MAKQYPGLPTYDDLMNAWKRKNTAQQPRPTMLDAAMEETLRYAQRGIKQRQEVANTLTGGMTQRKLGDVKTWDWDTARQVQIDNEIANQYFREKGLFNTEDYAFNNAYVHLVGDDYLKSLLPVLGQRIADAQKQDEAYAQRNAYRVNTWQHWSDMQNRLGEMNEANAPYFYAYADYLMNGDMSKPFDMDAYDAAWDEMDDDAFEADMEAKKAQFEGIDWAKATDKNASIADQLYESEVGKLEGYRSTIEEELLRGAELEAMQADIRSHADYGSLSQYKGMQADADAWIDNTIDQNDIAAFNDLYSFMNINASWEQKTNAREKLANVARYLDEGYDYLTPDELADYNALYNAGRMEDAEKYLELLRPELLYRRAMVMKSYTEAKATNPYLAVPSWLDARIQNVANVFYLPQQIYETATGRENPYSAANDALNKVGYTTEAQMGAIQNWEAPEVLKDIVGLAYQGVTGATDNTMRLVTAGFNPTASLIIAGLQSVSGSLKESAARDDMSAAAKIVKAIGTAAIEVGTEKIGLDALFATGKDGAMQYIKNVVLSELGEETLNYLSEDALEGVVAFLFDHEADIKSGAEFWEGLTETAITTMLSSLLMGGGGAIAQDMNTRATGKQLKREGDIEGVLKFAESMPAESASAREAAPIRELQKGGKKVSTRQLGKLVNAVAKDIGDENAATVNRIYEEAIEDRLVELGEDAGSAKNLAPIIRRVSKGEQIPLRERAAIAWTDNASQVVKELATETREGEGNRVGQSWKAQTQGKLTEAAVGTLGKAAQFREALTSKTSNVTAAGKAAERAKALTKGNKGKNKLQAKELAFDDGTKGQGEFKKVIKDGDTLKVGISIDGSDQLTEVSVDSLTGAGDEGLATILEYAAHESRHDMSAEEINIMAGTYAQQGGNAQEFIQQFEDSYLAGYSGVEQKPSGGLMQIAYEHGRYEAVKDEKNRVARAKKARSNAAPTVGWLGDVTSDADVRGSGDAKALDEAAKGMTEGQQLVVEFAKNLSRNTGLNIVMFRSKAMDSGSISTQNGSYDAATNTIYLDVNAGVNNAAELARQKEEGTLGYAIMRTVGHEVTHAIEATSVEFYDQYKQAVKEELTAAGMDWAQLVRRKLDNAMRAGQKLTYAGAEAEVVADASEYMLQDSQFVNNMDAGLKNKVKRIMQDFIGKIRAAFKALTGGHEESMALRTMQNGVMKYSERLQKLWNAGFVEMATAKVREDHIGEATEMVQHSPRNVETEEKTSIKDQLRAVQNQLNTMDVVASVHAPTFDGVKEKDRKTWAINELKASGYKTDVKDFGIVEHGEKEINNSLNYLNSNEEIAAFACIPRVLKRGIRTNGHENHKGRNYTTVTFAAPVEINGVRGNMAVVVKQTSKNHYKTHRVLMPNGSAFVYNDNKKTEPTPAGGIPSGGKAQATHISSAANSVPQSSGSVNGNIQKSAREKTETANEAYEKYREASMRLNDIRKKQRELQDSDEMKAVYELMDKDAEAGAVAYKNLLDSHGLNVNTRELQKQESELYRRWEELRNRELEDEEAAKIEKSGKTEADYRRDMAVKEFGYTPYFYDAGYIVPNGKMLNFSGEKNRHFGSRGQDHRAVSTVYANKTGSEAMVAFMHGGNIRIMPESPGLDIASSVEPTAQQYATIRKFVREYGDDEYLNIDFTNEKGNVVGNLEYEGRIYPDRVANDIKHYFETGEIREQGISAFMYSRRDEATDGVSIREFLGSMKPTERMTETEKLLLKRYQENLRTLEEKEKLVAEQEEIIRTVPYRTEDGKINQEVTMAKNRYQIYRNQANRAARALMDAERSEGFARVMATSQEVVNRYLLGSAGAVGDAADVLDEEIAGLTVQLKAVEADVTRTASGQRTAFARGLFDQKQLNDAAQKLKDTYGSRMSVKAIADRLALAYGEIYAENGAEGAKLFMAAARDLAEDMLRGNKFRYKSEILPMLAEQIGTISLTETDVQEIRNAGLTVSEYKRMLSPYIKVVQGGSNLSNYASNAAYYGEGALASVLGEDIEGNLAMRLYDVISREKDQEAEISYEGMSEGQLIAEAMADIAGANLPMSTDSKTVDYLRKELLKYAGENAQAAQKVEQAIMNAQAATRRASGVWRAAVQEVNTAKQAVEYYRKLEEQRRLTELKEQKQEITAQLRSDYAKKLEEKVQKQRAEYREREQKAREYRHSREKLDKLRRRIGRNVKRLNTMRMRETDQRHVPQEFQHMANAVMQTFTDSSLAKLAFSAEKTASLARRYRLLQAVESDMTYYWDDEIEGEIENLVALSEAYTAIREREAGVPSYFSVEGVKLETEILTGVDNIVSNVLQMIDSANDAFLLNRTETFNAYATKTGEEIRKKQDYKQLKGWPGKVQKMVDENLRTGNMTPIYFMEHLNCPLLKEVFDEVRMGQSDYAKIVAQGKDFVQDAKEKYHYGAWVADGKLKMKTSQGHQIELTREEAAELYAIAKRESTNKLYQTEHLLYGGFQYKDITKKGEGLYAAKKESHQLDAADIAKISRWLTDEQKAYADTLVGFLSTTMADYGNAASMEMYGYKKFKEAYYIPFHTAAEQRFQRGDEGPQGENAGTGRLKNSGFTKKLQHGASATLVVGGLTDTVAEHIHKMATYAAMVQPIENMKRLLNHKVMENDGTVNTIRALIGQKYGQASQDYMAQLLKDLNGAAMGDERATGLVNSWLNAFKRGAVMASASVVLQQPTAMARAMAYISPKYFTQNPFYRPGKGTWDEMMKYAGTAVIKDMGKFDVGMGLTARQYIADEHLNAMEAYSRLKADSKWEAGKEAYKRALDWLTAAPGKADQWTWGLIWKAVKAEQAELHPGMDVNSEEFLQLCGERFDDVIDHTQVYDSVITRSNLMRSKNALHRMATSFMSEPTLSINMLYDAFMGKHDKKQRAKILGGVIVSQVMAGALAALAQAWNDDEDKRNVLERYADRATANILDNLNPLGMLPYVSDLMSLFMGYEVERPDMAAVADIIDYGKTFITKAADPDKDLTWKDYENFVGTIANMAGLPAKNISREVRRTRNLIVNSQWTAPDAFNVGQAMMENVPFYQSKNAVYYERIVAAELKGDVQKAEDYREYMLLSKMVSEKSLTEGLRAAVKNVYQKGKLTKQQAKEFLIDKDLAKDEQEAFTYVDKWDEEWMRDEDPDYNHSVYNTVRAAIDSGNEKDIVASMKELTNNGWKEKDVEAAVRDHVRESYMRGRMTKNQVKSMYKKYCLPSDFDENDENDWYWLWEELEYGKKHDGKTKGWGKYNEFYTAVETGTNLKKTIQKYLDHGVEKKTLSGNITTQYKQQLIDLKASGKGYADLQARILTAYEALGYDRAQKQKDIQKWFEKK